MRIYKLLLCHYLITVYIRTCDNNIFGHRDYNGVPKCLQRGQVDIRYTTTDHPALMKHRIRARTRENVGLHIIQCR